MHTTHTQTANAQRPISNEVTSEFQSGKAEATVGLAAIENLSMEIHQLRYFVAVANEGSFSARPPRCASLNLRSVNRFESWKRR